MRPMNIPVTKVRIPPDLLDRIKSMAVQEDRSVSNQIVALLRRALRAGSQEGQ